VGYVVFNLGIPMNYIYQITGNLAKKTIYPEKNWRE
jgi:hypothetical protein